MLEELQQTYNDVTNTTLKNLNLEERGQLGEALKGWKSLHTLLLYKIDLFEKKPGKIHLEEALILNELKGIRDENVRHLVRIQLRLDEQNRRAKKAADHTAPTLSLSHNLSTPSLRNNNPSSRSLSGNGSLRHMMKTLRNNSAYKLPTQQREAVKQAANISWLKPKQKSPDMFDDFDQTELTTSNWERLNSGGSSNSGGSLASANLIDLEDDEADEAYTYTEPQVTKSLEDLAIRKKKPPPPPPPKRGALLSPQKSPRQSLSTSPPLAAPAIPKAQIKQASKSTPDIRQTPPAEPKKYVYNQPKPLNINKMMQQSGSRSSVPTTKSRPAAKAPAKTVVRKPAALSTAQQAKKPIQMKKSNITYNYVPLAKSAPAAKAKAPQKTIKQEEDVPPHSPTMDDILGGYDNTDDVTIDGAVANDGGMSPEEQDALIQSIRGIDELSAVQILTDIVVRGDEVYWDDIVGLDAAKNSLKEAVVYPFLRPDLFRGLREPTRGMLLFGPPGTGKTMLARAVATESKSTFFSISSSSLTSKYLGESEKLVKALFLLARKLSPSIVFIDEIDSLLGTRTEGEVESTRRIKNEFLVQWSELSSAAAGRDSSAGDVSRVLILGATNLPWGIDDAARRRFAKRVYIPLPEDETRKLQIKKLLAYQNHTLLDTDFEKLVELTKGFSGSDITLLAKDSAMGPLRSLGDALLSTPTELIRPIQLEDFIESLKYIRPSVSTEGLGEYSNWAAKFGSSGA